MHCIWCTTWQSLSYLHDCSVAGCLAAGDIALVAAQAFFGGMHALRRAV